jgi:F-type H+-transporting ATPase subunit alpha
MSNADDFSWSNRRTRSSLSPTDKYFWKPSFSSVVSVLPSMSVFQYLALVLLPKRTSSTGLASSYLILADSKIMKKFAGSLKLYLAQYREVAAFAQFGSDLDAATRFLLSRGARLTELLSTYIKPNETMWLMHIFTEQGQYQPLPTEIQVPIIYAGVNGLVREPHDEIDYGLMLSFFQLDSIPVEKITQWEAEFRSHLTSSQTALLEEISGGDVTAEMEAKIKKVVEDHVSSFI